MSPLVWDLAHIAAYEDLWLAHRHGERELLHPELARLYDAFETPRAVRGEIEALGPPAAREYLREVRDRSCEVLIERGSGDGVICEMVAAPRAAARRDDAPDDGDRRAAACGRAGSAQQ